MTAPHRYSDPPPVAPDRQPMFNAPPVVLWIIGITVAMHVLRGVAPDDWVSAALPYLIFNPAHVSAFWDYPIPISARWVGHALVHAGWLHLLVNCGFLLAFGTPLARQIPVFSFIALYLGGAAGGAYLVFLLNGPQDMLLVGASGAVSALIGGLARMIFIRRGGERPPPPFHSIKTGGGFVLMFILVNIAVEYLPGPGGTQISGEGHIGGFIAGIILSLVLPWRTKEQSS